jgi:lipoprotein-anchoring transpeptidase ErfK/SrfK
MKKLLFIISIFLIFQNVIGEEKNAPLSEDPFFLFEEEKYLNELFHQIQGLYVEGLYSLVIPKAKEYLQKSPIDDPNKGKVIETLVASYYYTGNIKDLYDLVLKYGDKYLSKDLIVRVVMYFQRKEKFEIVNQLFEKFSFLKNEVENRYKRIQGFELGKNIFLLENGDTVFGENKIYISPENQTLVEIAKQTDMGYFELKLSNPDINPFAVKKGQMILIPRRRIIPELKYELNEIYINLSEKRLYYPTEIDGKKYVITFPVGIGTDETGTKVGEYEISQKRENPSWYVPENIKKENPELPDVFPPGKDNPLGTRAMRLGHTELLIHGTNKKFGIGMKVSHGCIRMYNRDVERLFNLVKEGTKVKIIDLPYKLGFRNEKLYVEISTDRNLDLDGFLQEVSKYSFDVKKMNIYQIKLKLLQRGYAIPFN